MSVAVLGGLRVSLAVSEVVWLSECETLWAVRL